MSTAPPPRFSPQGGANALAPRGWAEFYKAATGGDAGAPPDPPPDPVALLYEAMTGQDTSKRDEAGRAWHRWGFTVNPPSPSLYPSAHSPRRAEAMTKSYSAEEELGAQFASASLLSPRGDLVFNNPISADSFQVSEDLFQ